MTKISLKARIIVKDSEKGRFGGPEFELPIALSVDSQLSNEEIAKRVAALLKSHFAESPLSIA